MTGEPQSCQLPPGRTSEKVRDSIGTFIAS